LEFVSDFWISRVDLRSWGSRVRGEAELRKRKAAKPPARIAPGSPFDFAHLADLLLRALRIKSPNHFPLAFLGMVQISSAWLFTTFDLDQISRFSSPIVGHW
jgi:hypothetical protein